MFAINQVPISSRDGISACILIYSTPVLPTTMEVLTVKRCKSFEPTEGRPRKWRSTSCIPPRCQRSSKSVDSAQRPLTGIYSRQSLRDLAFGLYDGAIRLTGKTHYMDSLLIRGPIQHRTRRCWREIITANFDHPSNYKCLYQTTGKQSDHEQYSLMRQQSIHRWGRAIT